MKKKKVVFQSDWALAKTGFGRNCKALLEYLHNTGKYDIVNYCCGIQENHPELGRTPWKSIGCLPSNPAELNELNKDPQVARAASYGSHRLDNVIFDEKPDVYIAAQDIWGVDFAVGRKWFKKINSVIWTTLDSMPILPSAISAAKKTENFWVWSSFATDALHELGHKHVKTVHGTIDDSKFKRLSDFERRKLRRDNGIDSDDYVVGFVFRNQLRKSVPNLLKGYKEFQRQNPQVKAKLLLHTHFGEGWDIHRLAEEHQIDKKEILTTHVCRNCMGYNVKPFEGQDVKCEHCGDEKAQITTQPGAGVSEEQLNEIYNLMDVYCHPFTSGGQEIPIQEAKLTELITLVTNYSCGEEMCEPEACSLSLDWTEYREPGTQFIKASTSHSSIAKNLKKVYEMKDNKKREMGQKARQWVLDNFSIKVIGKYFEDYLDSLPETEYDFVNKEEQRQPFYEVPEIKDDAQWLIHIYKHILRMDVDEEEDGFKYWTGEMKKGMTRDKILEYFRQVALKENEQAKTVTFEDILDKDDKGKRIVYVMPDAIGDVFLSTSLFKSIKEMYPDYNLYVATKQGNFDLLDGNPHVHKTILFNENMNNLLWLEGNGDHEGYFEIAFLPYLGTQKMFDYQHNGKDKISYDTKTCTS